MVTLLVTDCSCTDGTVLTPVLFSGTVHGSTSLCAVEVTSDNWSGLQSVLITPRAQVASTATHNVDLVMYKVTRDDRNQLVSQRQVLNTFMVSIGFCMPKNIICIDFIDLDKYLDVVVCVN